MNPGLVLAILAVIGYIGFELYAVQKAGYRMEAPHIYGQLVSARHAMERCGDPDTGQAEGFRRTFATVQQRAEQHLAKAHPEADTSAIDEMMTERAAAGKTEVNDQIEAKGCGSQAVWKHRKRFEIYARKTPG
jgi:Tfp pilus assembly protein PilE